MILDPDDTYLIEIITPGEEDEILTGTWSMGGDVLTLDPEDVAGNIRVNATLSNGLRELKCA